MARTIIYSRPTQSPAAPSPEITFGGPSATRAPAREPEGAAGAPPAPPDDYKDKIAKYVPAEVLAFFAPMAAGLGDRPVLLFAAAAVGLVATPGYLWQAARQLPPVQKPLPHFYVLAAVSFVIWAIATTQLGAMIGLDRVATSVLLGATVFLLPLVDTLLAGMQNRA